jgi:hypothetical protein
MHQHLSTTSAEVPSPYFGRNTRKRKYVISKVYNVNESALTIIQKRDKIFACEGKKQVGVELGRFLEADDSA